MRLDAWIRQDRPLADRLRLVERLSQALNAAHDRGEVLAALDPARVEVSGDLRCDLSAAGNGPPEPGYAAPERLEGGPPSFEADIYSAGAIAWEVLVGRPCGELPAPLPQVAPDLPRDLASAVMGCLERSPQWRPKDVTYLAQLAAAHQKVVRKGKEPDTASAPPRTAAPRAASAPRTPPRRPSRSHRPLLVAGLAVLGAAALSYWWIQRGEPDGTPAPARVAARAPTRAAPTPDPVPTPTPTATPAAGPAPTSSSVAEPAAPTSTPSEPLVAPPPTPTPEPVPTPTPTPTPAPPAAAVVPAPAAADPPPVPAEPAMLTALSPLSVRRSGRALLDLRGTGLRPDLHTRVLPLREAPRGISVARQKWVSANLVTVLLELEETVTPGVYAVVLEDPSGRQTKPLQFTVTK
jgi:hypothetical protein